MDPKETHAAAAVFLVSWGLTAVMAEGEYLSSGLVRGMKDDTTLAVALPIAGPLIAMANTNQSDGAKALLAIDAVLQAASAGVLLYSLPPLKSAHAQNQQPVRALAPFATARAGGLILAGRF